MNFNIILDLLLFFITSIIVIFGIDYLITFWRSLGTLELSSLGYVEHKGTIYDLQDYFLDREGQLYSRNRNTWEIDPRKDKDILICSNMSETKSGIVVNTLRTKIGEKVTIPRKEMEFKTWSVVKLKVKPVGKRHLKVLKVS